MWSFYARRKDSHILTTTQIAYIEGSGMLGVVECDRNAAKEIDAWEAIEPTMRYDQKRGNTQPHVDEAALLEAVPCEGENAPNLSSVSRILLHLLTWGGVRSRTRQVGSGPIYRPFLPPGGTRIDSKGTAVHFLNNFFIFCRFESAQGHTPPHRQ